MEKRELFSPEESPRRADAIRLSSKRPFLRITLGDLIYLFSRYTFRAVTAVTAKFDFEDDEYEMRNPLELVYTISTKKLRKAYLSELLHHQDDVDEPFTEMSFQNPP
jgi:hypothetical protein